MTFTDPLGGQTKTLLRLRDVWGRIQYVAAEDVARRRENGGYPLVPRRHRNGDRMIDPAREFIHIDNLVWSAEGGGE